MDCCCNCHTSYSIIQIAKYKQCVQNILFAQQTSRPSMKKNCSHSIMIVTAYSFHKTSFWVDHFLKALICTILIGAF